MGETRSRLRTALAGGLLKVAIILTLIPLLTNFLFLIAGTFQVENASRSGSRLIGLSSLSMASFNGIVPSSNGRYYRVHFQLFPDAFTYSYPASRLANVTSGILASGPTTSFDPLTLIQSLPSTLSLPANESRCLEDPSSPDAQKQCSPFWKAVLKEGEFRFRLNGLVALQGFVMHFLALVVISLTLMAEACIRWRPGWMRCQCWWAWYRRMCPLPKGTADEMGTLDEHVWDGVRLWCYGLVAAYTVLPVVNGSFLGIVFVRAMEGLEYSLPKGTHVDARMGDAFLAAGWGSVGASLLVVSLVVARWALTRKSGWMEQQMEPLLANEGVIEEQV